MIINTIITIINFNIILLNYVWFNNIIII